MSKHTTTFVAAKHAHWESWRLPGLLTLGAALSAAIGAACFWVHQQADSATSLRASAGLVICLAAILQVRTAWIVAHRPSSPRALGFSRKLFRRALFVGIVGAYIVALMVGPMPGVKEVFIAVAIAWYTALLMPLSAAPETVANWRRLVGRPQIRRTGMALYWLLLFAVNVELGLRAYQYYSGDEPIATTTAGLLTPTTLAQADDVAPLAGEVSQSTISPQGQLRVAALGDEVTLAGTAHTNHLQQLSKFMPGIEVANWGLPKAGPQEYATGMFRQATRVKPDLMLVFVSVGDDITAETAVTSAFDWQGLQLSQLVTRKPTSARAADWTESMADSQEFLRVRSPQLIVCRTPIDDRMHRCWKQSLGHLTQLIDRSRQQQVPLALVVVPAEFQVNSALCDTLRRRMGYEAKDVDVQLPQRRLAAFAHQKDVAMLDLLPFLQRSEESPYQRNGYVWNATGHQIAAQAIGGWLQSKYANHVAAATTLTASR